MGGKREKMEYREFRSLLEKGMGERSQTEFAKSCGISREHLGKMIRDRFIFRPTKQTLKKLAVEMESVTLAQLYESCGYTDEASILTKSDDELTEIQRRKKLPLWLRCRANADDIKTGIRTMEAHTCDPSFEDIFATAQMLYAVEDVRFNIRRKEDGFAVVEAVSDIDQYRMTMVFVLYYAECGGEKIILSRTSFAGKDVLMADGLTQEEMQRYAKHGVDISAADDVIILDAVDSAKERLLSVIFGDDPALDSVVSGFGFYLREVPPHFWEFMEAHQSSFCRTKRETDIYKSAIAKKGNPEESFSEYERDKECDSGYAAAIAQIMCRETGIPFEVYEDKGHEYEDNPMCLICEDAVNYDDLEATVYGYAKELGVPYIQECYFKMKLIRDPNSVIKVE